MMRTSAVLRSVWSAEIEKQGELEPQKEQLIMV